MSNNQNVIDIDNINSINLVKKSFKHGDPDLIQKIESGQLDSSLNEAFNHAKEDSILIDANNSFMEKELHDKHGIETDCCYNSPCKHCDGLKCDCSVYRPVECLYRMITTPPNQLDYSEYMPSHKEALDCLEAHGLLKGERAEYEKENSRYDRAKSYNERENTEVRGITMSQLIDCIKTATYEYIQGVRKYYGAETIDDIDTNVIARNSATEVEKAMHIYPNIVGLK
jgi:hypothetical protein